MTDRADRPESRNNMTPVPDPTVLTTQQLQREITATKEVVETKLNGIREKIETRIEGMDKAIELLQASTNKFPDNIERAVERLQELHDEKFSSIETQFIDRDTRTEQTSRDSKVAVDAALQAAKEAVGEQNKSNALAIAKSETTFTKQIDQIGVLITTMQKNFDDKMDDMKERIQAAETRMQGMESQKKGSTDNWSIISAVIAAFVGIGGLVLGSIIFVMSKR